MPFPKFRSRWAIPFRGSKSIRLHATQSGSPVIFSKALKLDGYEFKRLELSQRGDVMFGEDATGEVFVKIAFFRHASKYRSVFEESLVIEDLNSKGAVSCPGFVSRGKLQRDQLPAEIGSGEESSLDYFITRNVRSSPSCTTADLLLAISEQQQLGWFQGDLKPSNIKLDTLSGALVLVDYDQAITLTDAEITLDNVAFLNWTFEKERERYGQRDWLRHFPPHVNIQALYRQYRNGALNLADTTVYRRQRTTNTKQGVYHTVATDRVFADGVRDLYDRKQILDKLELGEGERVLDVGCNVGLLSHYLWDRGCDVTGFELDAPIVSAAKSIANILGKSISFEVVDIDSFDWGSRFDTVMLFSVFHHTENLRENGRNIAAICRRVVIECRLVESGKKPSLDSDVWHESSSWNFSSLDDLYRGLEDFFPGFKVTENFGLVDKDRYIIELKKT